MRALTVSKYVGRSTEKKPTLRKGDRGVIFYEEDTGQESVWSGVMWVAGNGYAKNTTSVLFNNVFCNWVATPVIPITTDNITLDLTSAVNGGLSAIYYKGNVLGKDNFIGGEISILSSENVLNELCIVWIVYDKGADVFNVNIQTQSSATPPTPSEPISPTYTLSDLTVEGVNYLAGSAGWSNMGITTTPIGVGDFEYSISLEDLYVLGTRKPMFGLSTDGTNRSFSTVPQWEIVAYHDGIFKVLANGSSDGTLTESSDGLVGSGAVIKRVGSVITLIQRETAGDTIIHTFSASLSDNVYLHITQNSGGELLRNPLYLQQ